MSLLLKNELRLRLGPSHCEAAIWRAGLHSRCDGRAAVSDESQLVLTRALEELIAAGHQLPSKAVLCIEDELLFYTAFPALDSRAQAQARAADYFEAAVEGEDLLVETTLAPCGRTWIAVAVDARLIETWRVTLADRAVDLRHVRSAALEDLWTLRDELPPQDSLVVMVRHEGATMVVLRGGCVEQIIWERCDVTAVDSLAERVVAVLDRVSHGALADSATEKPAVLLVPRDPQQHACLLALAAERQWTLARAVAGGSA